MQWWSQLGQAGADNVVLLPGVSLTEAQELVDILYGREKVSNGHFTVIEDTGVTEDILPHPSLSRHISENPPKLQPAQLQD